MWEGEGRLYGDRVRTDIKNYLEKEKLYVNSQLGHLNEANVVSEFEKLVKARPDVVVMKLKEESPRKRSRKRKRADVQTPNKKAKAESRKIPSQGTYLSLTQTHVKSET